MFVSNFRAVDLYTTEATLESQRLIAHFIPANKPLLFSLLGTSLALSHEQSDCHTQETDNPSDHTTSEEGLRLLELRKLVYSSFPVMICDPLQEMRERLSPSSNEKPSETCDGF